MVEELKITRERDLSAEQAEEIRQLQHEAFPNQPDFAHQRWYGTPLSDDDVWFGLYRDGKLVGSIRLVHRNILAGEKQFRIAGLANVCSSPRARGTGAGKRCMLAFQDYITKEEDFDFGMLFCGSHVHDFYKKLGWHDIDNEVLYETPDGNIAISKDRTDNFIMIYPAKMSVEQFPSGRINLNGPTW